MRPGRPALNFNSLLEAVTATAFSARSAPSGSGDVVVQAAKPARASTATLEVIKEGLVMGFLSLRRMV